MNSDTSYLVKIFLFFTAPIILLFSFYDVSYIQDLTSIILSNYIFLSFILLSITVAFINFLLYKKEVLILELVLQIFATIILIFLIFFVFFTNSSLKDTSIFNGFVTKVTYEEPWTEEYQVEVCSGSGDNRSCHYETRTRRHSASYYITTSNNERVSINSNRFNNFQNLYHNKYEIQLHRSNQTLSSKMRGEGDKWVIHPTNTFPTSVEHNVVNYIKISNGTLLNRGIDNTKPVLSYPTVTDKGYGKIYMDRVLKSSNLSLNTSKFNNDLNLLLAEYGKSREVNLIIYFTSNYPSSFPKQVEKKWGAWKKNDVVIFIDIKPTENNLINRVYVEAFTKHSLFKIELRDKIYSLKNLDLNKLSSIIKEQISISPSASNGFKRTSMEEYKYLINEINISWYWWLIFIAFSLIVNLGISYFVRNN